MLPSRSSAVGDSEGPTFTTSNRNRRIRTRRLFLVFLIIISISALVTYCVLRSQEPDITEWLEVDYYVASSGDAEVIAKAWLQGPRSHLFKEVLTGLPKERLAQDFIADIKSSLAEYGIEARDARVEFPEIKPGESFNYTVTWSIPAFARWNHDHWEIRSRWLDPSASAARALANLEHLQMGLRALAREKKLSSLTHVSKQVIRIHLPEGAENVRLTVPQEPFRLNLKGEYGHIENSLSVNVNAERVMIVENVAFTLSTETQISRAISPERFMEAFPSGNYTILYDLPAPSTWSWLDSLTGAKLNLKYDPNPISEFALWHQGEDLRFSAIELLYVVACAVTDIQRGSDPTFRPPLGAMTLGGREVGDFNAFNRQISRGQYARLAEEICDTGQRGDPLPGSVVTAYGRLRMRDLLYTLIRALSFYREHGHLPQSLLLMPVPSGTLLSNDGEIPAAYAYFLLPSTYVVTGSSRVERILNYIESELLRANRTAGSNSSIASRRVSKLRAWVSDNLTYRVPTSSGRDSEEVLKDGYGNCKDYTNVFLALARSARIPARRIYGWIVPKGPRASCQSREAIAGHAWAEVYLPAQGWVAVDPQAKTDNVPYRVCIDIGEAWYQALAAYEAIKGPL